MPTNVVHEDSKDGFTGCGIDINQKPDDWKEDSGPITCNLGGCKK